MTARVAVLGPGRVGTLLAVALARGGDRVVAVAGGREASQRRLAEQVAGVRVEDDPAAATARADLVVVTPPDDALEALVDAVAAADGWREGQRVVHCSGAQGLEPLRRARLSGARVAACHPAQTVPAGASDPDLLVGAAWAVTAAPADRAWAHGLVEALGGQPHDVPDAARVLYHAGLVVGANAVGAAVAVARQLLLGARVDAPQRFLAPLVEASVANVLDSGAAALTGPVVRGDVGTIARHLEVLDVDAPRVARAYRDLTHAVLEAARPGLSPAQVAAVSRVLEEGPPPEPPADERPT